MILLLGITTLCFLTAFVHFLTKPLITFLLSASKEERQLQAEISALKEELEDIPMRQEYTNYVKTERKIVATQSKLNKLRSEKQTKNLVIQYAIPYGSQIFLSFTLLVLSFLYRYTPVIVFDGDSYDFTPFGSLIGFPTGVNGAISVPFWVFVNSYVSKHVASYL